jgi:Aminotransferase class-III
VRPAADVVGQPLTADDGLVRAYRERTPGSAAAFEAARRVLPGGETRAVTSYPPYPLIITEGNGARLADVDGHSYLDLVNNYTAMVHGSAFAPVTEAVAGLLPRGFAFASPHPHQIALAELLAARLPSVQRVRFTNSGTEAALLAARIVVRATGRRRLLMFDGAYHGSATLFLPGSPDVVRVPWNDLDAVAALLGRPDHDVAAVFAEPFLGAGGVRPAAPGFDHERAPGRPLSSRTAGRPAPGPAAQRRLHHPAGHDQPVHRARSRRPRRHRGRLCHRLHADPPGLTGAFHDRGQFGAHAVETAHGVNLRRGGVWGGWGGRAWVWRG